VAFNRFSFLTHSSFILAQLVAKRLYDSGNGTINAEVTGRTTQIEVNADGTKTMLTGGTKTVWQYDLALFVLF
jgi:diaminopimelate epimerase